MNIMEIVLLAAGGIVFILSFLIPMKKEDSSEETRGLAKEEVKALVTEELESVRGHVDDVVEEAVNYSIEKTERSLERLSNEKIMAVSEYSDTVLSEIHKNHEEVMFLYDMLNDKHMNLKNTVSEINRTVKEAKETKKEAEEVVNTFQRLAPEAVLPVKVNKADVPQTPVASLPFASVSQAVRKPVMEKESVASAVQPLMQEPAMVQESAAPLVQKPVTVQESPSQVMRPLVQKPVTVQESPSQVMRPLVQKPVMMQESPSQVMRPLVQEPVMMQESPSQVMRPLVQEPVMMQESLSQVMRPLVQEPVMMQNAPVSMIHSAAQEAIPVSTQTITAPQIFASAPTPVSVQIPVTSQSYPTAQTYASSQSFTESVQEFESPLPPGGTISFTQETDRQGRNYNELIMEMYQNGKSNVAIARELNLGVGEVKLVIDLYKNRSEK